jgi:hypothetical protein
MGKINDVGGGPPGFATVSEAVPAVAKSLAGTVAETTL